MNPILPPTTTTTTTTTITTTTSPTHDTCAHLRNPNPYTVALATFILLGILLSYLPQHAKIITTRTSAGLSPYWILLGALSAIAALGNILVLPRSRRDIGCCRVVSGGECAAALLGVGQIGLQWGCFMFIVLLFLIFFPTNTSRDSGTNSEQPLTNTTSTEPTPPPRSAAYLVATLTLLTLLLIGLTSLITTYAYPDLTQPLANTLGTIAGTLAMIQYLPQIYFTYRLGSIGSLSVITMLMQVPGSFLFAGSLWLRVGWVGWSTWVVYIVTGSLQGVLLGLAIFYWLAARKQGGGEGEAEGEQEDEEGDVDERTALLSNGHGGTPSKTLPTRDTQKSEGSRNRQLSMLYAATPPEHDSEGEQ